MQSWIILMSCDNDEQEDEYLEAYCECLFHIWQLQSGLENYAVCKHACLIYVFS